jgi:transcriptional regulator of acetoin/glycerol metabolism
LLVAELPPGDERDGQFLRLLLALESGRQRPGGGHDGEELPVWLREFPAKIRGLSSPALLVSEPGSGMEELVRGCLREQFGSEEEGIFFHPGRLSEAVQLREIFGDSAGARLGGAGAGLPLLERSGRLIFIQEAGLLSHQAQLRLYARLAGEEDDRFWIFGSSRDLEAMAGAGEFLSGLARLLGGNQLVLPPVRACREFLEEEVERLLDLQAVRTGRVVRLSPEALDVLMEYEWPGNWWELRKVLESAVLLCEEGIVRPGDLRLDGPGLERPDDLNLRKRSEELEKSLLLQAHALHGGNQVQMARALGISRGSLQYKLEKYGLSRKEVR